MDYIINSLLDNDWYKYSQGALFFRYHRVVNIVFRTHNRTTKIKLANEINKEDLVRELDHVRTLRYTEDELQWLISKGIADLEYIDHLRNLQMGEYNLLLEDGQWVLEFPGPWITASHWEIYSLAIMSELRSRYLMSLFSNVEQTNIIFDAKQRLQKKLEKLNELENLALSEFGTRRRFSYVYQFQAIKSAIQILGDKFTGTSNCYIAMQLGLEPKGTNAHELPMVLAALAETDEQIKDSQYQVLREWESIYGKTVFLPDTFGTTQFLNDAPANLKLAEWNACRVDSKKARVGTDELINFWINSVGIDHHMNNPMHHTVILADGMDVDISDGHLNGEDMYQLAKDYEHQTNLSFGWGTNMSNGFKGLVGGALDPISLVCKIKNANRRPATKLSDNHKKAMGPKDLIKRYVKIFGTAGISEAETLV